MVKDYPGFPASFPTAFVVGERDPPPVPLPMRAASGSGKGLPRAQTRRSHPPTEGLKTPKQEMCGFGSGWVSERLLSSPPFRSAVFNSAICDPCLLMSQAVTDTWPTLGAGTVGAEGEILLLGLPTCLIDHHHSNRTEACRVRTGTATRPCASGVVMRLIPIRSRLAVRASF
jgi:hypothetical protein